MSRILVVEDEEHIADGLRFNLEAEGHQVTVLADGEDAIMQAGARDDLFDLIVLDVMLPRRDGFEVASTLRSRGLYVPILMLTARSRPSDVLRGFEAGADDYLPKPFELGILLARINGLLRRRRWNTELDRRETDVFTFAGRTLDFTAMELRYNKVTSTLR